MELREHLEPETISIEFPGVPPEGTAPAYDVERLSRHATKVARKCGFRGFYDSHLCMVGRALSRLGVREQDVMDQTQKVFLIAFQRLPEFMGRSKHSTWLWEICRRVASGYRRSRAVQYEVPTDTLRLGILADRLGARSADTELASHAIERILGKLPERQRAVFTLSELEEMDGPEIAKHLNISIGAVRCRLRYARQALRREVRRLGIAEASRGANQPGASRRLLG
jgi:RNA polymerase sigma-70 factor, ECF subfamily